WVKEGRDEQHGGARSRGCGCVAVPRSATGRVVLHRLLGGCSGHRWGQRKSPGPPGDVDVHASGVSGRVQVEGRRPVYDLRWKAPQGGGPQGLLVRAEPRQEGQGLKPTASASAPDASIGSGADRATHITSAPRSRLEFLRDTACSTGRAYSMLGTRHRGRYRPCGESGVASRPWHV